MPPVIVGITGASGSVLALNAVDQLLRREVPTVVVCSNHARMVWQEELSVPFSETLSEWREDPNFKFYSANDLQAPIASGTYPHQRNGHRTGQYEHCGVLGPRNDGTPGPPGCRCVP